MIIHWVVPLPRMPVTTRIITFLVGNPGIPINLHLPLLLGGGTTQMIHMVGCVFFYWGVILFLEVRNHVRALARN